MDTSGLVLNEPEAFQGYTLIAPWTGTVTYLADMHGDVLHQWDLPTGTESAIMLPNGNLLRWGLSLKSALEDSQGDSDKRFKGPGVAGGLIVEVNWKGSSQWRFVLDNDDQLLHHDIALLLNCVGCVLLFNSRISQGLPQGMLYQRSGRRSDRTMIHGQGAGPSYATALR